MKRLTNLALTFLLALSLSVGINPFSSPFSVGQAYAITIVSEVDVRTYGAKGDGVTDDTAAIQTAINSVPIGVQGGYVVKFSSGIYVVSNTITVGARRLILRGPGIIGSNGATLKMTNANKDIIDYTTGNTDTLSVFGLQFQGTSTTGTGRALVLGSVAQSEFDCRIQGNWFVGISAYAIYGVNLQGCHLTDNGFDSSGSSSFGGIYILKGSNNVISTSRFFGQTAGGVTIIEGEDNTITSNMMDFNGAGDTIGAITINANTAGGKVVRNTLISSNAFRANVNDIVLIGNGGVNGANTGANDTHVVSNSSDRVLRRFLSATDSHMLAAIGNKINSPSQAGDGIYPAIDLLGTSDAPTVNSNKLSDQTAGSLRPNFGLRVAATVTNLSARINDFGAAKTAAYSIASGATFNANQEMQGTWTPTIAGSSTPGSQTYSSQVGTWMRIGNLVYASCSISMTAKDGATAGNVTINGLPFDYVAADIPVSGMAGSWSQITLNGGRTSVGVRTQGGASNKLAIITSGSASGILAVVAADIAATTAIDMTIVYRSTTGSINSGAAIN